MADAFIQLPPDSTGKIVDADSLTVAGQTVLRPREALADPTDPLAIAKVKGSAPAGGDYGVVTRNIPSGTQDINIVGQTGNVGVTGPLTDAQLRATPVPVSGTVATGALTDTQLRASAVPVSGPVTDAQLRATAVPVSGPVTDAQLRATAVPVSGPLTDTQLRATPVPVAAAALPLPAGAATDASVLLLARDATLGVVGPNPGAYTVLDRLSQITTRLDTLTKNNATEATLKLVAAALQRPLPKPTTTLLHRS